MFNTIIRRYFLVTICFMTASVVVAKPKKRKEVNPGSHAAAEEVYRKIFPDATEANIANKEPIRAMYHRGDIVFTPLGQLDGYAVASRKFDGLLLYSMEESSALAKAGLKKWDLIQAVDGQSIPSVPLEKSKELAPMVKFATALMAREEKGGSLTLSILRNFFDPERKPVKVKVTVPIKRLDSFTSLLKTGVNAGRPLEHSNQALDYLLKTQKEDGSWRCGYASQLSTSLAGVHLIMVADALPERRQDILKSLKKAVSFLESREKWSWSWDRGAATWFLAEYFWATGDMDAYATLHRYIGMLDYAVNPVGGVCHKPKGTSYGNVNMGGPASLVWIALKGADQCRCAYNRETTSDFMDFHLYGFQSKEVLQKCNVVGYYGYLSEGGNIGETGFTSAAYLTGIHRNDYGDNVFAKSKEVTCSNIHELLQGCHTRVSDIHSTPSFGTLFTSLAFSTFATDSTQALEKSLLQKRSWQLVLSLNSKGNFFYSFPRYARMAIPGGGGWSGDGLLGREHLAALISLSLLNSHSKNLLVNAGAEPRAIGWLAKKRANDIWEKVFGFHEKMLADSTSKIKEALKNEDISEGLRLVDGLLNNYPPETFKVLYTKKVLSLIKDTLMAAEKKKILVPDLRGAEASAFLEKAYGRAAKKVQPTKLKNWAKRLAIYLDARPKTLQGLKLRLEANSPQKKVQAP